MTGVDACFVVARHARVIGAWGCWDGLGAAIVGLERADADPLNRLDHEMRQVILRDPVPKIGRKQKRLVPCAIDELAHAPVLA